MMSLERWPKHRARFHVAIQQSWDGGAEEYDRVMKWDGTGFWSNSLDFESEWI